MADDIDLANDRVLTETSALIAAASADLPVGHPGDCDLCGEWSGPHRERPMGRRGCRGFFRVRKEQVLNRYAPQPTFPRAVRLPTPTGGRGYPLWWAREVVAWAERWQE